jgi:RNA polymerase sigma factor (sigma-70 family)
MRYTSAKQTWSTMAPAPDSLSSALEEILASFGALVRQVGRRYRLPEVDVDEVMQEVRIRLWRSCLPGNQESKQIEHVSASYVYRTAVSAAIDILRRRRARRVEQTVALDQVELPPSNAPDPAAGVEESELTEQLTRALEAITPSRRPVVRMYLAGYSREEVAALMGWSEAKTRNLLYRGLADLREQLTKMGVTCESIV